MNQIHILTGLDRATIKRRLGDLKPHTTEGKAIIFDGHLVFALLFSTTDKTQIERRLLDEQLRYETARADKMILDLKDREGLVVSIEEISKVVSCEYTNVRARILSIPTRCAVDLAIESNPALVKARLDQEVHDALDELSADKTYEIK